MCTKRSLPHLDGIADLEEAETTTEDALALESELASEKEERVYYYYFTNTTETTTTTTTHFRCVQRTLLGRSEKRVLAGMTRHLYEWPFVLLITELLRVKKEASLLLFCGRV